MNILSACASVAEPFYYAAVAYLIGNPIGHFPVEAQEAARTIIVVTLPNGKVISNTDPDALYAKALRECLRNAGKVRV